MSPGRAASLGALYGMVAGAVAGLVGVGSYLLWGATLGRLPNYLIALIPVSLLLVVLPVALLGAGVGALTGALARRRPAKDTPLMAMGITAAVATCVGFALAPAGLVVPVLVAAILAIGIAAIAGLRLGRRVGRSGPG